MPNSLVLLSYSLFSLGVESLFICYYVLDGSSIGLSFCLFDCSKSYSNGIFISSIISTGSFYSSTTTSKSVFLFYSIDTSMSYCLSST